MHILDTPTLTKFLKLAGERLTGDWVLMGGTVLPLLGIDHRTTTDIDLVGVTAEQQGQTLELMKLAEELGLPVESINQAGAYFLARITSFHEHLVPLHRGKGATIHRPDVTLYLLLKIPRLTESDLQDCLAFLRFAQKNHEALDKKAVLKLLQQPSRHGHSPDRDLRIKELRKAIENTARDAE